MNAFKTFPDHAKTWIYASSRPITLEEYEYISADLSNFIVDWAAHGAKLKADFALLHKRFIIITVDEGTQDATGCSIDSCVHKIQAIVKDLNIDFFNRMQVVYRDLENNMVVSCSIPELKEMIANHDFPKSTPVFNNSLVTLGDLRTKWEVPAAESWISRYFNSVNV